MDKPVEKDQVIEKDIFVGTIEQGKLLLDTFNKLESGIKSLAVESSKYFAISVRTLADLEKRKEALDRLVDLEKANTQVLKQKTIVATALEKLEKDQLKNTQELEKLNQQKLKTAQETEKLEKQRIQTDTAQLNLQKKLEQQAKAQVVAVENSTAALRKMQRELANLPAGSQAFNDLAKKAGLLRDKIEDAKSAVKAFASESKLTNAKTLFGQIIDDLKNLNFADAADKAKMFSGIIKSMTFTDVIGGIKNFGTAMIELGKSLLLNPFVLITVAIIGLIKVLSDLPAAFNEGNASLDASRKRMDAVRESTEKLRSELKGLEIDNKVAAKEISEADGNRLKQKEDFKTKFIAIERARTAELKKINEEFDKEREDDGFKATKNILEAIGVETNAVERKNTAIAEMNAKFNEEAETVKRVALEKLKGVDQKEKDEFKKELLEFQKEIHQANVDANKKNEDDAKEAAKKREEIRIKLLLEEAEFFTKISNERIESIIKGRQELNKSMEESGRQALEAFKRGLSGDSVTGEGFVSSQDESKLLNQFGRTKEQQDAADAKENKRLEAQAKKRAEIANTAFDLAEIQTKKELKLNDQKLNELDKQLDFQKELAISGQKNTYAELQKERAKALDEQARLEKQAAREQEARVLAETFLEFYKNYASDKLPNPFGRALLSTFKGKTGQTIVKAFAGAFKEGVEGLDGEGTGTSDSNVALLSKGESVTTAKGTAETPGLVTAINKKGFEGAQEWAMKNIFPKITPVSDERKDIQVARFLAESVRAEVQKQTKMMKQMSDSDLEFRRTAIGEIMTIEKKMGVVEVTTYLQTKPSYAKR